jgi:UDP-N-acetylmuramoyl-L-alanyl-D-glutamate--2,6-diaminopimelate ligase
MPDVSPAARNTTGTTLTALRDAVGGELRGPADVRIRHVTHDSRSAEGETVFIAVRGFNVDGHRFVPSLVGRAAAAVVEDWIDADIPQLRVADTRLAMGRIADIVYGRPSSLFDIIGVTGTNGKTTVTYMLEAIIGAGGRIAGRLGTTGAAIAGAPIPLVRTTPEASELHRLLADMVDRGVDVAAVEVSSHALRLGRVEGVRFAVAAFTNLSQDHLDFHSDMDDYFDAKASLFDGRARSEVVWIADPWGRKLATMRPGSVAVGFDDGDVRASHVSTGLDRSTFALETPLGTAEVVLPLGGTFNVANAALAAACALEVGIDLEAIVAGLRRQLVVPGRMEPIDAGQPFVVLVDYAHAPDGIQRVVADARRSAAGRVIVVIGAGGDRDRDKRPLMGRAAAAADVAIITSDNPRSEDPNAIIAAVLAGTDGGRARVERIPDRRHAIQAAIDQAREDDVVLILGKGHETGQEIAGEVHRFDDRDEARVALRAAGFDA